MEGGFLQLLRIPETRKKITFTLGILLIYRFGFQVPLPGMSPEYLNKMAAGMQGSVFGVMNAFSGGAIGQTAIFGLGIMPYISASIIFSMLSKVSPRIEAVAKEGAAGQKKINQWTRLATVPIAVIQAVFVYTGVFHGTEEMLAAGVTPGVGLFLRVVLGLTAGAIFVMWLGELVTEHGIGNGASLIIMAGIIASMPASIAAMAGSDDFYTAMVSLIFLWTLIVVAIVYITKGARRIPMQYARLTRGRRVYGGARHYLPIKVNMAGVMPIIFASILFVVPGLLFTAIGMPQLQNVFSDPRGFLYIVFYSGLIFAFCFFWNRLMFQPEEIAKDLRERGAFIPGIRPGARTAEFLDHTLTRITLAGAAFLAVIAVLPGFVTAGSGLDQNMAYFLGGTSVLIVVGVAMDVVDKLNAQLVMRNYEGFMKGGGSGAWGKKGG
jgi:preprotein translocase subunit SecY